MSHTKLQRYFILDIVTHRSRQTMRFRLSRAVNFAGFTEDDKLAFTRGAVESSGAPVDDDAAIEVLAFSSRARWNEEYERIRSDKAERALRGTN